MRRSLISAGSALLISVALAPAAAAAWEPGPELYDVRKQANVPVTMSDGTVLRADVYSPTDRETGEPAEGPFPVLLTQTPYGKDSGFGATGDQGAGPYPYAAKRGYLNVVADVRGTGASHGSFGIFDPPQARDGVELVEWASRLPRSNGKVGLYGESYLGINQMLTAANVGRRSPLKAIFPITAGNDIYRDVAFFGGVPALSFDVLFLGVTAGLNAVNPVVETVIAEHPDLADAIRVELDHIAGLLTFQTDIVADVELEGEKAFDGSYWRQRRPQRLLRGIVRNRVPMFLVSGWWDVYQRGAPLNYSGLQNAVGGRPIYRPMKAGQPANGRYQLLMGPWLHLTVPEGIDLEQMQLRWFDRWLKGDRNGIEETRNPLHVHEVGSDRFIDTDRYPFDGVASRPYYLGDGTLGEAKPAEPAGADTLPFMPASSPCSLQTQQYTTGWAEFALHQFALSDPCLADDRPFQASPGALTYTTEPLAEDKLLAGPIGATIFATSNRPESYFELTIEDVSPDGASKPLTSGGLLGSFRALDEKRTWRGADGEPVLPYHPFTRASSEPVVPGELTRYDIEVNPIFARLAAGHRLRATITSADTPHLGFTPAMLRDLAGASFEIQRNAAAASFLELPLAPAGGFAKPCRICVPTG